jgi:outer membrane cobalamin receptor
MRLTFIFLTFFFGLTANAQNNFVLKGTVTDSKTYEPLENVSVVISDVKKNTLTNTNGFFEITSLKQGTYFLTTSIVGYTPTQTKITLKSDSVVYVQIKMVSEATELSEVTVIGETEEQADAKKVKQNVMPVTIITAKQIENRAGNLNEILARQAGIQIRNSGGLGSDSRISVRGLEGKRVQIFLDGNPLNSPDGSLGINDLPVQIIERIEIYKGSVPAWLGGDGLGSAVNVILRHRDVSYIDASVSRQSYNTQFTSLILKKSFDKQGIEAGFGVFDTRSDNDYVMQSPFQPELKIKRDHDKYHSLLMGGAIHFHKTWFDEIEIEGAYIRNNKQIQGIYQNIQHITSISNAYAGILSLTKNNFANNKFGLKYNLIYAKFDVKLTDTSSFNYNWDGTKIPSRLGKGELGNGPNLSTNLQQDLRQRFNLDYRLNKTFTLNLNNTARYVTFNPNDDVGNAFLGYNAYNYPGSVKNSITGLTAESRFKDEKLLFSAALKHYYNIVDGYNTSIYVSNSNPDKLRNLTTEIGYNAGFRYNFNKSFLAKGSYERGVRLPNNIELFGDGILITPTTSLKPEVADNYNIGLIYDFTNKKDKRLQIEANGFYMNVDNLIQLSGNGLSLGYVNYAKANITGADVDIKYDVTKNIFSSFNATYQILTDINKFIPATTVPNPTYKLQIPNTPQFFMNWNVEFHKTDLFGKGSKSRIMYDGSFVDRYSFGFNISIYDRFFIPQYLTHTVSIEQSFKDSRYTITAEVNNLTDQNVINNFNQPLAGRTFRIKLRYLLLSKGNSNHSHQ